MEIARCPVCDSDLESVDLDGLTVIECSEKHYRCNQWFGDKFAWESAA